MHSRQVSESGGVPLVAAVGWRPYAGGLSGVPVGPGEVAGPDSRGSDEHRIPALQPQRVPGFLRAGEALKRRFGYFVAVDKVTRRRGAEPPNPPPAETTPAANGGKEPAS